MSFGRPAFMARLSVLILTFALLPITPTLAQSLFFTPAHNCPGSIQFTADLDIDTAGELIMGAEVFVTFDPTIVSLDSITAGDWVTGATPAFYFYDYTTAGTNVIHLSMAFLGTPVAGSGTLAVCHFTALAVGTSPLIFNNIAMRDAENFDTACTHSTGDDIFIDAVVGESKTTFGQLKLIFR